MSSPSLAICRPLIFKQHIALSYVLTNGVQIGRHVNTNLVCTLENYHQIYIKSLFQEYLLSYIKKKKKKKMRYGNTFWGKILFLNKIWEFLLEISP